MKNVLVTGGSRGIGKEIVKECLYQDYRVHFTYSNDITSAKNFFEEMNSVNFQKKKNDYKVFIKDSKKNILKTQEARRRRENTN